MEGFAADTDDYFGLTGPHRMTVTRGYLLSAFGTPRERE